MIWRWIQNFLSLLCEIKWLWVAFLKNWMSQLMSWISVCYVLVLAWWQIVFVYGEVSFNRILLVEMMLRRISESSSCLGDPVVRVIVELRWIIFYNPIQLDSIQFASMLSILPTLTGSILFTFKWEGILKRRAAMYIFKRSSILNREIRSPIGQLEYRFSLDEVTSVGNINTSLDGNACGILVFLWVSSDNGTAII